MGQANCSGLLASEKIGTTTVTVERVSENHRKKVKITANYYFGSPE